MGKDELGPTVTGEVFVDGAPAARPCIVVVDNERAARRKQRNDALKSAEDRFVPVAVDVREPDRSGRVEHLLEGALDKLNIVDLRGNAESPEIPIDGRLEIIYIAVVFAAARWLRGALHDFRISQLNIVTVCL